MRFSWDQWPRGPPFDRLRIVTIRILAIFRLIMSIVNDMITPLLWTDHDLVVYYLVYCAYYS
jgi:hypothetical protein